MDCLQQLHTYGSQTHILLPRGHTRFLSLSEIVCTQVRKKLVLNPPLFIPDFRGWGAPICCSGDHPAQGGLGKEALVSGSGRTACGKRPHC